MAEGEYFSYKKINDTTYVIIENDEYGEKPFIYAKLCERDDTLILSDTGCGGGTEGASSSLRAFLETCPLPENDSLPLNPRLGNGKPLRQYLIIMTHCHYDHILGISQFQDARGSDNLSILASEHGRSFIQSDLPSHSLCKLLGIPTPEYSVSHWARDLESVRHGEITILQTPGHTADELAWYDVAERQIYVGDTFYYQKSQDEPFAQPIIFPPVGANLTEYMASLEKMQRFVSKENEVAGAPRVKVGCGHTTWSCDAATAIAKVQDFFSAVLKGQIPVQETSEKWATTYGYWESRGDPKFSLSAPRALIEHAREQFNGLKV